MPKLSICSSALLQQPFQALPRIQGLASGRLGKHNIFVRPGSPMRGGCEEFLMALPGCMATLERRSDDIYYLVRLELDNTYAALMAGGNKSTGLYKAEKQSGLDGLWRAEYYKSQRSDVVSDENNEVVRLAAVVDGHYGDADKAANKVAASIGKAPGAPDGERFRVFDLHYTHGESKIGGLVNFQHSRRPLNIHRTHGSALMLAKSMSISQQQNIMWVAERGGCAVLTQAMQILVEQNIALKKHSIFLYEPSTSPAQTVQLAHRLGMMMGRNVVKTGSLNYMGNRDQLELSWSRYRAERSYTIGNLVYDTATSAAKVLTGPAGLITGALALGGVSVAAPSLPMLAKAAAIFGTGVGALKLADKAAESIAPHRYNKHIGKIK